MKRLSPLLATVAVTVLVPLAFSGSASAASTCDVGFTGPDSENMCTSIEKYACEVTNTNEVEITNTTDQVVASGSVSTTGNTTGGNSTSGSVTNDSGTVFTVTIINGDPYEEQGDTCTAAVVVPAEETPETVVPTRPVSTNGGGGAVQALPVTGDDSSMLIATLVAGSTALLAAITTAGVLAYRYFRAS